MHCPNCGEKIMLVCVQDDDDDDDDDESTSKVGRVRLDENEACIGWIDPD